MAQLRDDCFAFARPLLAVAEAERLIAERIVPVAERETVALREAAGRVLAADVVAPFDLPPFDNSAVDGYAVRAEDLDGERETRLPIAGRAVELPRRHENPPRSQLFDGHPAVLVTRRPQVQTARDVFDAHSRRFEGRP